MRAFAAPKVGLTRIDVPIDEPTAAMNSSPRQEPDPNACNILKGMLKEIDNTAQPNGADSLGTGKYQTFVDQIIEHSLTSFGALQSRKQSALDGSAPNRNATDEKPDHHSDAVTLFFLMCMFRRPRNLSSLVAIVERFQAMIAGQTDAEFVEGFAANSVRTAAGDIRFDIDGALETLIGNDLVRLSEGELYFIPEHVHQVVYKLLSSPLRLRQWCTLTEADWEEQFQYDLHWLGGAEAPVKYRAGPAVILRAAWLGRVHSAIGRDYYTHVWQRSQDTSALFEYLYHRLASLRYLMMLRFRLEVEAQQQPRNGSRDQISRDHQIRERKSFKAPARHDG